MFEESYHFLNNVQSTVLSWGNPFNCNGKDVIFCITGNPGVIDFYVKFGEALFDYAKLPVCIVGHSGQNIVPDKLSNVLKNREHLYNLQAQLHHKVDLINKLDAQSKLHVVGHSIGAWMIVEILNSNPNIMERVKSVHLLFPTLQKMAETTSGIIVNKLLRNVHSIVVLLIHLLYLLPESVRTFLINQYVKLAKLPDYNTKNIIKYINPTIMEKVMMLAYDEMDYVVDLNVEALDKIKSKTHVIYSPTDGWAPISYINDLRIFMPDIKLEKVNIDHAFVLKSSEKVASIVSDNIALHLI